MTGTKTVGYLTRETLVPISLVATVLACALSGALWMQSRLSDLAHQIQLVQIQLQTLSVQVGDQISEADMRAWISVIRAQNPSLVIPEFPPQRRK